MYNNAGISQKGMHMSKKPTLWTRNFTLVTFATVIIAIGYVAMDFVMSLVVFDFTKPRKLRHKRV